MLAPSMLQIKALPVVPEKPTTTREKTNTPYRAALAMFIAGIVCAALSLPIGWLGWYVGFNGNLVFRVCLALGFALAITSPITVLRFLIRPKDVNILSRTFFTLGIVLLFLSLLLAISLYLLPPDPRQAEDKRVFFTHGTLQRPLFQDSTPIPMEERAILRMTPEIIDQMMPIELHLYFQTLEEPMFSLNFMENYEAVWATYRIWVTVNIILAILAFASIVVSFFMPKQNVVVTGWSGTEW